MNTNICLSAVGLLLAANAWGASCTVPGPPKTFYVSLAGHDSNDGGTPATAFRKIQTGVNCLVRAGDRLVIFPGTYPELVRVASKKGEPGKPIVIEGMLGITPEPAVTILGTFTSIIQSTHEFQFHKGSPATPNDEWLPVGNGEYVSVHPLPLPSPTTDPKDWDVNQGAFVEPVNGRHTRLIAYHRIEDLRAANETFEEIVDCPGQQDPRPGPIVGTTPQGCTKRRPWVYMGPGLWFDKSTKKVHIRLSPTHNNVPGLADYNGETDPNKLALAIGNKSTQALTIEASTHVQFKNLAIKYSAVTVGIKTSSDLAFDNVAIWAGQFGVRAGNASTRLTFSNCVFDGGLPTWMFRGDIKNEYKFTLDGAPQENVLGKQTLATLIGMEGASIAEIHHSEFTNGHDLYLQAPNTNFHHNWISNMHDDALFLDGFPTASGSVHHNVIEKALAAVSLAGDYLAGPWYIYRNLIDLRQPTAGFRPFNASSNRSHVWRPGSAFKEGDNVETPNHIFQNTFIVPFAAEFPGGNAEYPQASFRHLRNSFQPLQDRSSLNNAFVVLNREANQEAPIAFLLPPNCAYCEVDPSPSPAPPQASARPIGPGPQSRSTVVSLSPTIDINGDLFYRKGYGTKLFATPIPGDPAHFHLFSCMPTENCLKKWRETPFFLRTLNADPPGYEADGVLLQDPQFTFWTGEPDPADDFRLKRSSPAFAAGVPLPRHLSEMDTDASGIAAPDIGAYQSQPSTGLALKLRVGVRSRKVYPQSGAGK